jgi:HAMP domain-containing protein
MEFALTAPMAVALGLAALLGLSLGVMACGFYANRRLEAALGALDPKGSIAQQLTKERGDYVNQIRDLAKEVSALEKSAGGITRKLEDLTKTINADIDNPETFKPLRDLKLSADARAPAAAPPLAFAFEPYHRHLS